MILKYALLGFLSRRTLAGYELKKQLADSTSMDWLDQNNQMYEALIQLRKEGLVEWETDSRSDGPDKKSYRITEQGLAELKQWIGSVPETPKMINEFLTHLAFADLLEDGEMGALLEAYENAVKMQLLMLQEKNRRKSGETEKMKSGEYFRNVISERMAEFYGNELAWIGRIKEVPGKSVTGGDLK